MKMLKKFLKTSLFIIAFMFVSNFSYGTVNALNWGQFYDDWWNNSLTNDYDLSITGIIMVGGNIGIPLFAGNTFTIYGTDSSLHGFDGQGLYSGFILNNKTVTFRNLSFRNFLKADTLGAVIYADQSSITFNATADIIFSGNRAVGKDNDIYLTNSKLYLNANDFAIKILGGIYAENQSAITFSNTNRGEIILSGINVFDNMGGFDVFASSITVINSSFNYLNNTNMPIMTNNSTMNFINSTVNFLINGGPGLIDGGAIYAYDKTNIIFSSSVVNFTSNSAVDGGAIFAYDKANIIFSSSAVMFTSNSATVYGGAIFAYDKTNIIFSSSVVNFLNNRASYGGAIYGEASSNIIFSSSAINFTSNSAVYGGALNASDGTSIIFSSSVVNFTSNSANDGGAVSAYNGRNIIFSSSVVSFLNNRASLGGAISGYYDSNIIFSSSVVNFLDNWAATGGGAIYTIDNSCISFSNSETNFIRNSANDGGAVFAYDKANIIFSSSTVNFINNQAVFGGAIEVSENSNIIFSSSTVNFINNQAPFGGAIEVSENSNVIFSSSTVNFISNSGYNHGGAIFANSGSTIIFSGSAVNFTNNSANNGDGGGAIYAKSDSNIIFSSSAVNFTNNSAFQGGAIFAPDNSVIKFINSDILFSGNTVGGGSNDININGIVQLIFDIGRNNKAVLFGGIVSGTGNTITKTGIGEMKLGGLNAISGNFNVEKGTLTLTSTQSSYLGKLNVSTNAVFSTVDEIETIRQEAIAVDSLNINGVLNIGIHNAGGWVSDIITANSIVINPNTSQLALNFYTTDLDADTTTQIEILRLNNQSFALDDYTFSMSTSNLVSIDDGFVYRIYTTTKNYSVFLNIRLADKWDEFVIDYQNNKTNVLMTSDLKAVGRDLDVGSRVMAKNIIIDGQGHTLDADNLKSGFELNSEITLKNITLTNFKRSNGMGGAISVNQATITVQSTLFTNNSAYRGGAVAASGGSVITLEDTKFTNNEATIAGGALYIDQARVIVRAARSNVTFEGNHLLADTDFNDIDMTADSQLVFDALAGRNINIGSGLKGAAGATIIKQGAGELTLGGLTDFKGQITIDQGSLRIVKDLSLGELLIEQQGKLTTINGDYTNTQINNNITVNGTLEIEVSDALEADIITANEMLINPNSSILNITYHGAWITQEIRIPIFELTGDSTWNMQNFTFSDYGGEYYTKVNSNTKWLDLVILVPTVPTGIVKAISAGVVDGQGKINSLYNNFDKQSMWVEAHVDGIKHTNADTEFKSSLTGFQAGKDIYTSKKGVVGLYAGYDDNDMTSGKDKIKSQNIEAGVYAGLIEKRFDLKANVSGARQSYEYNSKIDFDTNNIRFGSELGYKVGIQDTMAQRLFVGLHGGYVMHDDIIDPKAYTINANSFMKLIGVFGLGIEGHKKSFSWYAKVYERMPLVGNDYEYNVKMKIDKSIRKLETLKDPLMILGGAVGTDYKFTRRLSVYSNLSLDAGDGYFGYYANLGLKFDFDPSGKELIVDRFLSKPAPTAAQRRLELLIRENERRHPIEVEIEALVTVEVQSIVDRFGKYRDRENINIVVARFDPYQTELTGESKKNIQELVEELKGVEFNTIQVIGHADINGAEELNVILSQKRAKAVYDYLLELRVPKRKLDYKGLGSVDPIFEQAYE